MNEKTNYYISEDFSEDFYIYLAYYGFICTSTSLQNKFYLLAEMQFEYAILDFKDLHISKKIAQLIKKDESTFSINTKFEEVINKLEEYHKTNWVEDKYKNLLLSLKDYKTTNIDFKIIQRFWWHICKTAQANTKTKFCKRAPKPTHGKTDIK